MKAKLTDAFVKNISPPAEGRIDVVDETTPGLVLRVTATGIKSWSIRYRPKGGAQMRQGFGTYPATSLADARARAKALTAAAAVGRNLVAEEAAAAAAAAAAAEALAKERTVAALVEAYIDEHIEAKLRRSKQSAAWLMRFVVPVLGTVRLSDLRRGDVLELLDDIGRVKGFQVTANRVLVLFKSCLNWAVDRQYLDHNPIGRVKKQFSEQSRDRVLSDTELAAIWTAAEALNEPGRGLVKLMILTGQRRDECRRLVWSELDLDAGIWTLPAARSKNKREHAIPLSTEVVELLKSLPKVSDTYVFSIDGRCAYTGHQWVKDILDKQSKVEGWTYHDIRRTVASGMAGLRISDDVIGKVLNHLKAGVTAKHYNKHQYLEEKRVALQTWATFVTTLVSSST